MRMMVATFMVFQILALVARAEGQEAVPDADLVSIAWRSSPGNEEGLASELGHLYLVLYNTGSLAVHTVDNPDGLLVEPLLRKEQGFAGDFFPEALDDLLCDLNPTICSRPKTRAKENELSNLTGHVGGYRLSTPVWGFGPTKVVLPDYRLARYTTLRKQPVPLNWSPESYNPPSNADCSPWSRACADLVKLLNPPLLDAPSKQGRTAVLPITGVETRLYFKVSEAGKYADLLAAISKEQEDKGPDDRVVKLSPSDKNFAPDWQKAVTGAPSADRAIDAVQKHLPTVGAGMKFGALDEPLFNEQVDLFKLIHHPFGDGRDLDAMFRNPIGIMVLDDAPEPQHCDLGAGLGNAANDPCNKVVLSPNPMTNHATHVMGIIGASVNGHGIVGLNPAAKMFFGPVKTAFLAESDVNNVGIELFDGAAQNNVRVANLSWGFDKSFGEAFRNGLDILSSKMLIVAAAGNEAQNLTNNCSIQPACLFDLDNVITVVGLDRNESEPHLWKTQTQGSNSSPSFHIGAIAESVLSTVGNDELARMSGTSQAAPQVTAAASLIYSAAEYVYGLDAPGAKQLAPKVVKDRLIYTADIFNSLQGQVRSGRLNVDRAIDIVNTQIVIKRDGQIVAKEGKIQAPPSEFITCLQGDGSNPGHAWGSIRRMSYVPERDRYLLFENDGSNRNTPLKRIDGCNLSSLSQSGVLQLRDGSAFPFKLGEILDYTSPLLEE